MKKKEWSCNRKKYGEKPQHKLMLSMMSWIEFVLKFEHKKNEKNKKFYKPHSSGLSSELYAWINPRIALN